MTIEIKNKNNTKIISHRGLWKDQKNTLENTIKSIKKASRKSYDGIEIDLRKSKDGIFVINHDHNLERVHQVMMNISDNNYEDIKRASNKNLDLYIPTLDEYLDICIKYKKIAVIELKEDFNDKDVIKLINKTKNTKVVFISFIKDLLIRFRQNGYQGEIHYLYGDDINKINFDDLIKYNFSISPHYNLLNKQLILKLKDLKIKIATWTVNDLDTANNLIELGIDYITTDILS